MKSNLMLLILSALFLVSCASSDRNPASAEERRDSTHQKFQGYFDKPEQ